MPGDPAINRVKITEHEHRSRGVFGDSYRRVTLVLEWRSSWRAIIDERRQITMPERTLIKALRDAGYTVDRPDRPLPRP